MKDNIILFKPVVMPTMQRQNIRWTLYTSFLQFSIPLLTVPMICPLQGYLNFCVEVSLIDLE